MCKNVSVCVSVCDGVGSELGPKGRDALHLSFTLERSVC